MKIKIGNKVVLKNRPNIRERKEDLVATAIDTKVTFTVIKAIPMRGFNVKSECGLSGIFNGSDLRVI